MIQCNESSLWVLISTLFLFFLLTPLCFWIHVFLNFRPFWELRSLHTMNINHPSHVPFFLLLLLFKSKITHDLRGQTGLWPQTKERQFLQLVADPSENQKYTLMQTNVWDLHHQENYKTWLRDIKDLQRCRGYSNIRKIISFPEWENLNIERI